MATDAATAPKVWEGRFYEDLDVGDVFRSRFGRTVTEYDNILFTGLTHNTNSIHFDANVGGKLLTFGAYRLRATPRDPAGNVGKTPVAAFRVLR